MYLDKDSLWDMDSEVIRPGSMPLLIEAESAPSQNCQRLVILGSAKVGKTSIVNRFLHDKFEDRYTPTIEDFHRKIYRIRGEAYRLDILDTSGNHPFPAMRRLSLLTGDLFILVFSLDNRESFEEVKRLYEQILQTKGHNSGSRIKKKSHIPIVVVANKCDKECAARKVSAAELKEFTDSYPNCDYIETSAKRSVNIEELFLKLFMLAKLPTEMSPSLHRKVHPTYVGSPSPRSSRRGMTLRRRLSDACGAVAPNARRPSIRTDLLALQTKQNLSDTDLKSRRDSKSCVIQ